MRHAVLGRLSGGRELEIDLPRLLETRLLIQSSSGGGKSYCLRKCLEVTAKQVQQLVIDPDGEFSTLREKFDYLICAPHDADAVAGPHTARLLARRLMESGVSAVLDIYDLKAHDRQTFVRLFLEELVNLPKTLWHPVLVVLDEAHVYAPESGKAEAQGAVIDLATRGRKRGQSLLCATQRLSKLHKDVAAELFNKAIGLTGLDIDVRRASSELGLVTRDATEQLRNLEPGQFYVFGPALTKTVELLKVGAVETTHPKAGQRIMQAPPAPSPKLKAALAKLADLPQKAAEEIRDLSSAQRRIQELERELKAKPKPAAPAPPPPPEIREIEVLPDEKIGNLRELFNEFQKSLGSVVTPVDEILELLSLFARRPKQAQIAPVLRPAKNSGEVQKKAQPALVLRPEVQNGQKLGKGEIRVLTAIAQHPGGATSEQLTVLTGYKKSTRDLYLQILRQRGFIERQGENHLATADGFAFLPPDFKPLPTGRDLLDHWLENLPAGEKRCLEIAAHHYPEDVTSQEISELTGYKKSTRDLYLQLLRSRKLLVRAGPGSVRAAAALFD